MYQIPIGLSIVFGILLAVAGLRRFRQRRARTRSETTVVDDLAVAEIIERGVLTTPEDEPLDEEEIRRAEAEFWGESWEESWDEPEHFGR